MLIIAAVIIIVLLPWQPVSTFTSASMMLCDQLPYNFFISISTSS